jgi:protein arginine N-methyltransferase 1
VAADRAIGDETAQAAPPRPELVVPYDASLEGAWFRPESIKPLIKGFIRRCALSWLFASSKLHEQMLADQIRMEAYRDAILKSVKPGDSVLDIGTGTGIMAFFAARAGAGRVLGIDKSRVISLAREIARDNGLEDKVEFARCDSGKLKPEERFDVVISELLGSHVVNEGVLEILADARARLLKDGGTMIPRSLEVFLVPVSVAQGLPAIPYRLDGLDLSALKNRNVGLVQQVERVDPESCFLSEPARIFDFDFMDTTHRGSAEVSYAIARAGTLVGFLCYFVLHLAEGVKIDTSPSAPPTHWKDLFISSSTQEVKPGDTVTASLEVRLAPLASYNIQLTDHSVRSR